MPIQVDSFFPAPTGTWSHIASNADSRVAAIIDPVLDFDPTLGRVWTESAQALLAHVRAFELNVFWILETHAYADHLTAADWLKRQLPGARLGIGAVQRHFREVFGLTDFIADGSQFDRLFYDNERLKLGDLEMQVITTPGHGRRHRSDWHRRSTSYVERKRPFYRRRQQSRDERKRYDQPQPIRGARTERTANRSPQCQNR